MIEINQESKVDALLLWSSKLNPTDVWETFDKKQVKEKIDNGPIYKIPTSIGEWNPKAQEYMINGMANVEEFKQWLKGSPQWFDGKNVITYLEYNPDMANTKQEAENIRALQAVRNNFKKNPELFKKWSDYDISLNSPIKNKLGEYLVIPNNIGIMWTSVYKSNPWGDFEVFTITMYFDANKSTDLVIGINQENNVIGRLKDINTTLATYWYTIQVNASHMYELSKI